MVALDVERASLVELFDRHASLHIDDLAYQTNPELRDVADRICEHAGITSNLVTKTGITVYRTHAVMEVFETTSDGKTFARGGEMAKRTLAVDYAAEDI